MTHEKSNKLIGFYGFPSRGVLKDVVDRHGPDVSLVDLDVATGAPNSGVLPATTCRIIMNIIDNAVFLKDRLVAVVAAVGEDKCDRGRHVAFILKRMGFNVIETRFRESDFENRELVYSVSNLPVDEKINRIMDTIVEPSVPEEKRPVRCEPTHGFWGVPPNDFRILRLFPPTTHVYGWTRCVEAGRPGDLELESFVDEGVPTVFFTQSFCAKQDLAHYLAEKHHGLAIDCHRTVSDSILAKIEAFLRLA